MSQTPEQTISTVQSLALDCSGDHTAEMEQEHQDYIVNGLSLPTTLTQAIESGQLRRGVGSWPLREKLDSFGNEFETELGEVFGSVARIRQETLALPASFPIEHVPNTWPREFIGQGAIPDIRDFFRIVCFAVAGGGEPFCLDYREDLNCPSVIYWDDCYWRRVSPNFGAFLELFALGGRPAA